MAVVVATSARDSIGAQTIRPTKIPRTTRDTETGLDLRNVILIVSYLSFKQVIWATANYGQRLFTVYPAAGPSSTAVPLLFFGTKTLTVAVVLLPNESVTLNVIV